LFILKSFLNYCRPLSTKNTERKINFEKRTPLKRMIFDLEAIIGGKCVDSSNKISLLGQLGSRREMKEQIGFRYVDLGESLC